ncbi:troponin family protein [Entamoeba histolytica HM-3:IMSS]|uniref:Troponin family protein n=2 Tax=Entamoeba histolytica TaxID=5759 RepID=M2SAD6_ENTHI|nr:troponin family protein [Entamoeba histolytica KU27]EMS14340.1 troponin family protein [Entamoeba histolytica HM-3:IMSS]
MTEADIKHVFDMIDTDHSGYLDIDEFVKACSQLIEGCEKESAVALFHMADENGDGKMDLNEFKNMIEFYLKNSEEEDPYVLLFKRCDVNGDGVLDKKEVFDILQSIDPNITIQDINETFDIYDTDKNGSLDFDEYMKMVEDIKSQ